MLVRKVGDNYEFESLTTDSAFLVKLILDKDNAEKLVTVPVGVDIEFKPRELDAGTIQKTIGDDRWENFLRMKEKGITTMFIDSQKAGIGNHVI